MGREWYTKEKERIPKSCGVVALQEMGGKFKALGAYREWSRTDT